MVAKLEHKLRTGCPVACGLDIIGDHWTLLIIRNLMFHGLHEYKDMLRTEESISSNILTGRLKKLEEDGLIASIPHPDSQRRKLYYLTPPGKDLIYLMTELVVWSNKHLGEVVDVPAHKKAIIETAPGKFIEMVKIELAAWEQKYLPQS